MSYTFVYLFTYSNVSFLQPHPVLFYLNICSTLLQLTNYEDFIIISVLCTLLFEIEINNTFYDLKYNFNRKKIASFINNIYICSRYIIERITCKSLYSSIPLKYLLPYVQIPQKKCYIQYSINYKYVYMKQVYYFIFLMLLAFSWLSRKKVGKFS